MLQLSPSILSADFTRLGEQISEVEQSNIQWLHIDVMDGQFVPSISFGMPVIKSLRQATQLFFDVHLMIQEPIRYIADFQKAGANLLTVHAEACQDIKATIQAIKAVGCKAGLAINPETEPEVLLPWIKEVDLVLVMSVHPGFGGQKLIEETLEKMKTVRTLLDLEHPSCYLEADGGIYQDNVSMIAQAGVDVAVAGTAIFKGNISENIKQFRKQLSTTCN